jgi:hypothetical protein
MSQITPLEGVDNSSRLLRTSIYLRTSLQAGKGAVQDLMDCVVPIVSDSIESLPAGQIITKDLQNMILSRFSFKMPTFTIEHVLGRLAQKEKITYDKDQKAYFHQGKTPVLDIEQVADSDEKISSLEDKFSDYALHRYRMDAPPFFSNWSDVLVYFLHPDSISTSKSVHSVKGTLISDFDDIIRKVTSNFILSCEKSSDRSSFETILEVYGGILLGDFLQNVQSTGNRMAFKSLTILYDTTIMLRLLGCSGHELRSATVEMHRDLQSLGCTTEYLSNNETELANILDTIIGRYDSHQLIYGETGDALENGTVQIGEIRSLQIGYPEALAALNVFESKYNFQNTRTANYFQIDEVKFQDILAGDKDTYYGQQNRISDAQSLAVTMRLRQKSNSFDLANSKYVFITANSHLARCARRFIREELRKSPQYVPPMLTHSQISTAAWISNESKLQDSSITRELLANCMSAQQLSKDWVDGFVDMLKESDVSDSNHTLVHAVRSIARDESLGNPTILRKLNPNEMIQRARLAEEQRTAEQEEAYKKRLGEIAVESDAAAREEERELLARKNEQKAEIIARRTVRLGEVLLIIPCVYILIKGIGNFDVNDFATWLQPFLFVLVTVAAVLDLFQFQPIGRMTAPIRIRLQKVFHRMLYED